MSAARLGADGMQSPYPGLRPFRDDEASVFFGRDSQVEELLKRLASQHFVVVLGGSGSGKSSLVKAGVIPALRSYQLRDAGDVWVPVVATPGTNLASSDVPEDRRSTPIDRLAAKLAAALSVGASIPGDAARAIARRLRQHDGLQRVYEEFVPQTQFDGVTSPAALDDLRERTNLLIVLDQFEEVFHPSNADVEDCKHLVQRVLEHHGDAHPRMYLMLTMRSEYLNDCAEYLKLPDAINKASYLVRRLSPFEIGQVITLPAQHFATLMANRAEPDDPPLPRRIDFESAVLERLKADVAKLYGNPDHLPLLQHLLARLWEAAAARARAAGQVLPAEITTADLRQAAFAGESADVALSDENLLMESVEQWANHVWQGLDEREQQPVDKLLPRLAYKDPNTGYAVQRRLRAEDGAALMGGDGSVERFHALVEPFLAPLDYLHWDAEDPLAVTVKVSHESFIRGWSRFRKSVSLEADRFGDFLTALRNCEEWRRQGRGGTGLLPNDLLTRLDSSGYRATQLPGDQPLGREWLRLLDIKHDGRRWLAVADDLPSLAQASEAAIEEGRRQLRLQKRLRLVGVAVVAVGLVAAKYWSSSKWLDSLYLTLHAANAFALIDQDRSEDTLVCRLDRARAITERYVAAAQGERWQRLFGYLPGGKGEIETAKLLVAEGVGRMLEQTLDRLPVLTRRAADEPVRAVGVTQTCGRPGRVKPGYCQVAVDGSNRTIEIVQDESTGDSLQFWAGSSLCPEGAIFYALPPGSRAAIDKNLRYFISYTSARVGDPWVPYLHRMDWRSPKDGEVCPAVRIERLLRLQDQRLTGSRDGLDAPEFSDSWRQGGRIDMQVAPDLRLSLVDLDPRPTKPADKGDLMKIETDAIQACNGLLPDTVAAVSHRGEEDWSKTTLCLPLAAPALNPARVSVAASDASADLPSVDESVEKKIKTSRIATLRIPRVLRPRNWTHGTEEQDGWLFFVAGLDGQETQYGLPASIQARLAQLTNLLDLVPESEKKSCRSGDS